MLRVRLKADGRLVEILPDGSEREIAPDPRSIVTAAHNAARAAAGRADDAAYARNVRGRTGLTQTAFAARIGVPVETVRNWEQGKRSPRGPGARAAQGARAGSRSGLRGARQSALNNSADTAGRNSPRSSRIALELTGAIADPCRRAVADLEEQG